MTPLVAERHNSSMTAGDSSSCMRNCLYKNETLSTVVVAVEALVSDSSSPSSSFSYEQQYRELQQQFVFNERQQKVLAILPMFTGLISAISSMCIIYLIKTEDNRNKRRLQQQKDHFKKLQRKELESLHVAGDLAETAGRHCGVNSDIDGDDEYNLNTIDSATAAVRSTAEVPKTTAAIPATCTPFPRRRSSMGSNSSNGSNTTFVPVNRTFKRIMVGLSIFDLFTAVGVFASTFPLPIETNIWMASGTATTCEIQGVFIQAGLSSSLYSASLAIYFVLTIVPNCNKWCFSMERIEPLLHGIPIVFALGTAVVGLVFDAFNPLPIGLACWLSEYPHGCSYDATTDHNDSVQCLRGKYMHVLFWIFGGFPLIASYSIIILSMTWMCFSTWYQLRKVEFRYVGFTANTHSLSMDAVGTAYNISDNRSQQVKQRKELSPRFKERLRNVASQAFLYILVFFIAYICPAISRLMELNNRDIDVGNFVISTISSLWYPSQGFLNLLVYLRPRYLEIRRTHFPEVSRIGAIKMSLGILPEPDQSLQRTRRTAAARRRGTATRGAQGCTEVFILNDLNVVQPVIDDDNDNVVTNVTTHSHPTSINNNYNKHNNTSDHFVIDESNLGSSGTSGRIDFMTGDDCDIYQRPRNPPPPLLMEADICEQREKMREVSTSEQSQKQLQDSLKHDDSQMAVATTSKLFSSWPSVDEESESSFPAYDDQLIDSKKRNNN